MEQQERPVFHWVMPLIIVGGGAFLVTIGVLLIEPINDFFVLLGAATQRGEAVVPFVGGVFALWLMGYLLRHNHRLRRWSRGQQNSLVVNTFVLILLWGVTVFVCLQQLIFVLLFFFAG